MSVQANTQIHHHTNDNVPYSSESQNAGSKSAAAISVTARIDYIQRFSKQMTLVVDDNTAVYSQLARQYLANISQTNSNQEVNVAFLAASNKINDIQMRCRLIEQLFANTLFDPEQSLAVSLFRLAKQSNDTITIVIEHAQALSLQVKYELCQLVDVAKKTQNKINVVLFGAEQAAQDVAQNKTIFNKKISIIEASSGQVIALEHARFVANKTTLWLSRDWRKIALLIFSCLAIMLLSWFVLTKHENFSLATLPASHVVEKPLTLAPQKETVKTAQVEQASTNEIYEALLNQQDNTSLTVTDEVKPAEMSDILQALALTEPTVIDDEGIDNLALNTVTESRPVNTIEEAVSTTKPTRLPIALNEQYYLGAEQGYVVQIAGFSDLTVLSQFIKQNESLDYYSYQKNLNAQQFIVLTSQIYSDKAQAMAALNALPQSIKSRGSFLKSVSTIKGEINTVNL
ncbi:MAG: hypothetical protein OQK09_10775 [Colwellia sp.]|nr:hypothetical protein [Colwellia sp.]MCW8865136.1 hypothetical protein [Colwellia sp.]MCW9081983.1 hypothetical protein [Colwellia sp.]